jgi:hypothetical protein
MHFPCYEIGCNSSHACVVLVDCPEGHCLADNVTCAQCVNASADCLDMPCFTSSCDGSTHECDYATTCPVDHCLPSGECVQCVNAILDCTPFPCYDVECTANHTCDYTPTCPVGHCWTDNVTCVQCVDPAEDCGSYGCRNASCGANHTCEYTNLPDDIPCGGGDGRHCFNGSCAPCVNASIDCVPQQCHQSVCNVTGLCGWVVPPGINGTRCTIGGGGGGQGYCAADGTCVECRMNSDCVRTGCKGTCIDAMCSYSCGAGCVHALGWWYKNAATAFVPPVAPLSIAEGTISFRNASTLRPFLAIGSRSTNGLNILAVALLVARLNVATGANQTTAITGPMAVADELLYLCPPKDQAIWNLMLHTGQCSGYSLFLIPTYVSALLAYSNGKAGVPLCNEIGIIH